MEKAKQVEATLSFWKKMRSKELVSLAFTVAVIFAVNPSWQDPVNKPKQLILLLFGIWALLGFMKNPVLPKFSQSKFLFIVLGLWGLWQSVAFIFTDNKIVGAFGASGRNTGYLTYLALTLIFLRLSSFDFMSYRMEFTKVLAATSIIFATYGLLQYNGIDFIRYHNPYNPIIATVGNPDFASALMGILFALTFGFLFQSALSNGIRITLFLTSIELVVVVMLSNALQGPTIIAISATIILLNQIRRYGSYLTFGLGLFAVFAGIAGLMGTLNEGPLRKYLYKASVTFRGDYWRAGFQMMKHNLVFGVGLDRYGEGFRRYRDSVQVARHGPDLVANASHNVVLQFGATGGLALMVLYIFFIFLIGAMGAVKIVKGASPFFVAIYAAWICYVAQSIISIDQIALATLGWVLSSMVVSMMAMEGAENRLPVLLRMNSNVKYIKKILQFSVGLGSALALGFLLVQYQIVEGNMNRVMNTLPPSKNANLETKQAFCAFAEQTLKSRLVDEPYVDNVAIICVNNESVSEGKAILSHYSERDPKYFDFLNLLALIEEHSRNQRGAIPLRGKIQTLDPLNRENLKALNVDKKANA
jgi:hypothetical protein